MQLSNLHFQNREFSKKESAFDIDQNAVVCINKKKPPKLVEDT